MAREKVKIENVGNGALAEKFDDVLIEALEDIRDPNKEATAKRVINLRVTLKPDKNRRLGALQCDASFNPTAGITHCSTVYFLEQDGEVIAAGEDLRQMTFDDVAGVEPKDEDEGIVNLNERKTQ